MTPANFAERWQADLEARARVFFEASTTPKVDGTQWAIADAVVAEAGFEPIGFNWELLDPLGADGAPRAARSILTRAFESDMEFPKQEWLGPARARAAAHDFVALFEDPCTILSNRIEDYWNPVSKARIEWAFVGFDASRAALLVLMRD